MLSGYKLVFNVPGLPYVEPGFASVRAVVSESSDTPGGREEGNRFDREVHGVAYELTAEV